MRKSIERAVQPLTVLGDFRFLYLFLPATLVLLSDWRGFEALVKTFCVFYALLGLGIWCVDLLCRTWTCRLSL